MKISLNRNDAHVDHCTAEAYSNYNNEYSSKEENEIAKVVYCHDIEKMS